jgi:GT2 family glycosyltransferase
MENKFAIGIPTYNRFDLLHPALLFYVRDFPNTTIYIVDNGSQKIESKIKHPNVEVIESEKNIGVAASWNLLCDKIFKENDYAIILNDDIYLGRKDWEIDDLLKNYKRAFYCCTQDFASFIIPKGTYKRIGQFDDVFYPAYYEDNDYEYRLKLWGLQPFRIPFLNPFLYATSQTLEKEPTLKKMTDLNKQRYIDKWGGEPKREKFKKPYNK